MSISNITQAQTAYGSPETNQNQPTLKEADGVLLVSNGRTEHPLQNEHCKPCYTVFRHPNASRNGGLTLKICSKEHKHKWKVFRVPKSTNCPGTVMTYAAPNTEASQVNLSTDARMRAAMFRLQPEKPVLVDTTPPSPPLPRRPNHRGSVNQRVR